MPGKVASQIAAKARLRNRREIEVKDWGEDGASVVIYSYPFTARDLKEVHRKEMFGGGGASAATMVDIIIAKAEDQSGEKMFTLEDKPVLMSEPLGLIAAIYAHLVAYVPVEEQAKN